MHEYLPSVNALVQRELFLGTVIQAAIASDLKVESMIYPNGAYVDIGTPNDLARVIRSEISSKLLK